MRPLGISVAVLTAYTLAFKEINDKGSVGYNITAVHFEFSVDIQDHLHQSQLSQKYFFTSMVLRFLGSCDNALSSCSFFVFLSTMIDFPIRKYNDYPLCILNNAYF